MLCRLVQHFGEPVMPISKYCEAFEIYANVLIKKHEAILSSGSNDDYDHDYSKEVVSLIKRSKVDIHKSNLLFRLIYLGQPLRKEKCSIHKGEWNGQAQCFYGCVLGCDGTGFLKEPEMVQDWLTKARKNFNKTDEELLELIQEYTDAKCFPKRSDDRYFK